MKFEIKRIGFEENKKCHFWWCNNLSMIQIGKVYYCPKHWEGFIEFKKELEEK